jgi:hypothetical protein
MRPLRLALLLAALASPAGAVTLDDAIAAALAHDPSISIADADRDAAGGRLTQARSAGLPNVRLSGSIGVGQLDMRGFFGFGNNGVTPAAAQASIEQPLFSGGRVTAERDRARAGLAAARLASPAALALDWGCGAALLAFLESQPPPAKKAVCFVCHAADHESDSCLAGTQRPRERGAKQPSNHKQVTHP